ncbi:MAG: hypothetical protein ACR5KW_02500 [Wolbachia sp.]
MNYRFVFCHDWGFFYKIFQSFINKYFFQVLCYCLDLDYYEKINLNLLENNTFIIGYSLGLIKSASLNVKFNVLIVIQDFINFLGFNLFLHKKRKLELKAMIQHFQMDLIDILIFFHKKCGLNYNSFNRLIKQKLMQDLELLITIYQLQYIPLLILGITNDTIVSRELIYDNFNKDVKIVMHSRDYSSI